MNWWQLEIPEVYEKSGSSGTGLNDTQVKSKLDEVGPNELEEKKRKPEWKIFLNQFKDFMIVVLLGAAAVSTPRPKREADSDLFHGPFVRPSKQ